MPGFQIVNSEQEINLSASWVDSPESTENKFVERSGRTYRVIAEKERSFSLIERGARGFLGLVVVCCTIGTVLLSKSVRNLFTRKKEIIQFGMIHMPDTNLRQLNIENICLQSNPCQHYCTLINPHTRTERRALLPASYIRTLMLQLPPANVRNPMGYAHFTDQCQR